MQKILMELHILAAHFLLIQFLVYSIIANYLPNI